MNLAVPLLTCAALFAAFGLVMRLARRGAGCGGCTSACHRKEFPHG